MRSGIWLLLVVLFLSRFDAGQTDAIEKKLMDDVMGNYSVLERPVRDHRHPVVVIVKFILQQIVDVDERNQIITTNAWLELRWDNYLWRWDPGEYNQLNNTRIPFEHIWTPDIILYNSADKNFDPTTHTSVVVHHNGSCLYIPPGVFKSTCKINVSNFPFDKQNCTLKFGVWSYNGHQVDLRFQSGGNGADTSEYTESGEWKLIKLVAQRHSRKYACCVENFVHVTFTVALQRRTMFYVINLIIPCILNSILTLLTFFLPAEAAEKITLAITVLLAQIVFMLLIMETMPPTSDAVPIISKYFACSLFTVCASVAATVLVLSFYYTSPEIDGNLPPWLKKFLLITAPKWLHMKPYSPKKYRHANAIYVNNNNRQSKQKPVCCERSERGDGAASRARSRDVVMTCVDGGALFEARIENEKNKFIQCKTPPMSDDVIAPHVHSSHLRSAMNAEETALTSGSNGNCRNFENFRPGIDSYLTMEAKHRARRSSGHQEYVRGGRKRHQADEFDGELQCLREILCYLRKMNNRFAEEKVHNEVLREWQFAAKVLDKILLWIFSVFVVSATLTTLFAVPNIADAFAV